MRRIAACTPAVMGVLVVAAAICGGCGRLANHPLVSEARQEVERNPRVQERLAGPGGAVSCDNSVTGRANETDGIAAMEFAASGSRGRGTVVVEGKKFAGGWTVTRLELRPGDGGDPLVLTADLESRGPSDTPKFDPAATKAASNPAPPPPAEIEITLPPGGPAN
ncbi:MAG: cytochrome c oxidase assembly factor Coa1 family protein [Planctomycetia bacterium]